MYRVCIGLVMFTQYLHPAWTEPLCMSLLDSICLTPLLNRLLLPLLMFTQNNHQFIQAEVSPRRLATSGRSSPLCEKVTIPFGLGRIGSPSLVRPDWLKAVWVCVNAQLWSTCIGCNVLQELRSSWWPSTGRRPPDRWRRLSFTKTFSTCWTPPVIFHSPWRRRNAVPGTALGPLRAHCFCSSHFSFTFNTEACSWQIKATRLCSLKTIRFSLGGPRRYDCITGNLTVLLSALVHYISSGSSFNSQQSGLFWWITWWLLTHNLLP